MPAVLNNVFNLLSCSLWVQIGGIMFSRITLLAYCFIVILFLFDWITKYYEHCLKIVLETNTILSSAAGERPFTTFSLSILLLIVLYVIVNIFLIHIKATFIKFRSGRPPVGRLVIAYKFIFQDAYSNEKVITHTQHLFPNKKLIQLYYNGCRVCMYDINAMFACNLHGTSELKILYLDTILINIRLSLKFCIFL